MTSDEMEPTLTPDDLRLIQAALSVSLEYIQRMENRALARNNNLTAMFLARTDRELAQAALDLVNRQLLKQ